MTGTDLLMCLNDIDDMLVTEAVQPRPALWKHHLCAGLLLLLIAGAILTMRTPSHIRFGCNIRPTVTIDGISYTQVQESTAPDSSYVLLDSIGSHTFSAEQSEYTDAQIWISPDDATRVYVKYSSGWQLFVRKELQFEWICYQGRLYVDADHYETYYKGNVESYNSALLEERASFLDCLTFTQQFQLPTQEFTTNTSELHGLQIFSLSDSNFLIVEIPDGLSGGRPRYDRFYPIAPNAVFLPSD